MLAALDYFGVGLQGVTELVQQWQYRARRHLEALAESSPASVVEDLEVQLSHDIDVLLVSGSTSSSSAARRQGLYVGQRLVTTTGGHGADPRARNLGLPS